MSWKYTAEYYKQYTRDTWNESAEAYAPVMRTLNLFTPDLLRAAEPRPGERVLDVASGPGEPALTIAPGLLPGGSVLGIDLSERMVEIARRRASERGIGNASFAVMDAERMDLPDASFDLVVCRFGLQIVTDPEACAREAHRVLRPGGRLAVSVWGPAERNPLLHAVVGPMLAHATPDETGYLPTPYELGGDKELGRLLAGAGFRSPDETRVSRNGTFRDEEDYLAGILEGTPLGHSLREEDAAVQEAVLREARANLQRWKTPDGISMPMECLVVRARK